MSIYIKQFKVSMMITLFRVFYMIFIFTVLL